MSTIRRLFVEKRPGFDIAGQQILNNLRQYCAITKLQQVRVVLRYDVENISDADYGAALNTIFSEPPVDILYEEQLPLGEHEHLFAIEYLPGQYDQRADSAVQCIQIISANSNVNVKTATMIILKGLLSNRDITAAKKYLINPVDSHEASLEKPVSLTRAIPAPADVTVVDGFTSFDRNNLMSLKNRLSLAMSADDLFFCQNYFKTLERRDPTITEIRMLDTYWSDHCRHTTFLTTIEGVSIEPSSLTEPVKEAFELYKKSRETVHGAPAEKPMNLMDLATIAMKEMRATGKLTDVEVSDEVNACSIIVKAEIDGQPQEWLVMFKNETHNHPTEIEPFGGAATCLGGAIRDPLSGRSYVYQAMRVTGSADPTESINRTIAGKLPQRKITTEAAAGYSAYGNQIGLATGLVTEFYHEGYKAKRMEVGAVIGAAPRKLVKRLKPQPGDVIILLGGRTGRDGCGGATGSSKAHSEESILTSGAEVQKGNAPTERKIQRLFRNPVVSSMIKKCNDFGAGGVCVAIGELADGLTINLDAVPKKYEGLDGTELAISESQERMAVCVAPDDAVQFIACSHEENLEATIVAQVTDTRRVTMVWRGKTIVDLSRDFINTNGVVQTTSVTVQPPKTSCYFDETPNFLTVAGADLPTVWLANLNRLSVCSQQGLNERFDGSIGCGSVLLPFGGTYQSTPSQSMVAKLPVLYGQTSTATAMTFGFNPLLSSWSPFHGGVYAIVEALAKITATGADFHRCKLSLQEYFEKIGTDPKRWGTVFSALLGAFYCQKQFGVYAIGGKDSMSGSFKDMSVPPTLIAFAVCPTDSRDTISSEFKKAGNNAVLLPLRRTENCLPNFPYAVKLFESIYAAIRSGAIVACRVITVDGIAGALSTMCFGNRLGVSVIGQRGMDSLFLPHAGSILCEVDGAYAPAELFTGLDHDIIGTVTSTYTIAINGTTIDLEAAYQQWHSRLESVFPTQPKPSDDRPLPVEFTAATVSRPRVATVRPTVLIPVFPGTNCEYDSAAAFARAGASVDTFVLKNLSSRDIIESISQLKKRIAASQILMLPGGFSAADEPDGSGKFIAAVLRNPSLKDAVMDLLYKRDGLVLGICNGFQALIKLGLVPFGRICDMENNSPTLTFNTIGRHVSRIIRTRVCSTLSPWFLNVKVGDIHTLPVSHGEGRFIAERKTIQSLVAQGQIAAQYVDCAGNPTTIFPDNPNGSMNAIEAITSPDGRILGKMAHSERIGKDVYKNVPGNYDQHLFEAGVAYFK
ncbi:MAG: phosphoribosylformylglycinamidine synthase [Chitinivibrionales bacterium]|nr:phosphoribosylformylglycinamidine synthase [Chitinivibrionales bacterium]